MRDFQGIEIKAGDFVAYGVRRGNTGDLKVGLVIEVFPPADPPRWYRDNGEVKVRGCEPGWREGEPFSISKVCGRLTDGSRVIVLPRQMLRREITEGLSATPPGRPNEEV